MKDAVIFLGHVKGGERKGLTACMGDLHIIDKEPCITSSTVISHTTGSWEGWAGIHLAWINQTIYREGAIWTTCSD